MRFFHDFEIVSCYSLQLVKSRWGASLYIASSVRLYMHTNLEMVRVKKELQVDISRDEMTNLIFTMGYLQNYRYYRTRMLEKAHDTVSKMFSDLTHGQQESIAGMLRVELVVNAVMYSSDLASAILALDKPLPQIIKTISSLHETGSGSIKEFYERMPKQDFSYFWKLLRYDKNPKVASSKEKYERSCKRFWNNVVNLAQFYIRWYPLYSCYKHGLNIITFVDSKSGKEVLIMGRVDGTFDISTFAPSWYLGYAPAIETVFRIFNKAIDPLIWGILKGALGIDLEAKELGVSMTTKEPKDESRPVSLTFSTEFPWKIWKGKEVEPFY